MKITYDNTLAGWSQALEFRDKETKGHSNRVTNLTIKLANRIGIVDEDTLQHIRRGALLHDIGKMSIPNTILLKKGPLTAEDWEIVYQHPTYAYQMLKDIPFLTPALDIPYSHHEKWDGSGYPRGLKGEAIPISARLFALADVWDALTSERSYRGAWTEEKAKTYIRDQAGIHFDPQLVPLFLQILD
jgi:putative nucleotidyltransferase with HDIG domain